MSLYVSRLFCELQVQVKDEFYCCEMDKVFFFRFWYLTLKKKFTARRFYVLFCFLFQRICFLSPKLCKKTEIWMEF